MKRKSSRLSGTTRLIGWRERVTFPGWGIRGVEAKIDTGARTSALHVDNIHRIGPGRVRFEVVLSRRNPMRRVQVEADHVRITRVRSSTGHRQERYVVATRIKLGPVTRTIELSLVRRDHMLCRMLLGRSALEGFVVDVGRRYLLDGGVRGTKK